MVVRMLLERQVLVDSHCGCDATGMVIRRNMAHTWVVNHGHLAVGLLDLKIGRGGLDGQDIVVGGVDYHDDGGWKVEASGMVKIFEGVLKSSGKQMQCSGKLEWW